jgi:hypothetical protein
LLGWFALDIQGDVSCGDGEWAGTGYLQAA